MWVKLSNNMVASGVLIMQNYLIKVQDIPSPIDDAFLFGISYPFFQLQILSVSNSYLLICISFSLFFFILPTFEHYFSSINVNDLNMFLVYFYQLLLKLHFLFFFYLIFIVHFSYSDLTLVSFKTKSLTFL